jgi:hypothetical protein
VESTWKYGDRKWNLNNTSVRTSQK